MTGNDPHGDGKRSVRQYTPDYIENYNNKRFNGSI